VAASTGYRRILIVPPTAALPLVYGGSHEAFWAPIVGCFLLLTALFIWLDRSFTVAVPSRRCRWFVMLLLLIPLLQIIPLPASWLRVLSPTRAAHLGQAGAVIGLGLFPNTLSYVPLNTLFQGLFWAFLAGFALLLRGALEDRRTRIWYCNLLLAIGTLEACYGLLQVLIPSLGVLGDTAASSGFARGTFINRDHYAAYLGLLWPLLLGYVMSFPQAGADASRRRHANIQVMREQTRHKQILFGFLIGLILLALFFSASRGAILSSMVAATLFVVLSGTRRRAALAAVAGCWLVMLVYGGILGFDEIVARFNTLDTGAEGRFQIWREAWIQVSDHPLTGTGLGSFHEVYRIYQGHLPETMYTRHAHNDYLQLAAEIGLPAGIGVMLMIWACWWRSALRVFRTRFACRPEQRYVAAGALAGTAAVLLHSWLEFNWQMAAIALQLVAGFVLIQTLSADQPHA